MGTLTLTPIESYTGATTIAAGTLALGPAGKHRASSSTVIDNGTFDISATPGATVTSLAGSGTVALGAQTLTLTNAADVFSGGITGSGGLTLNGGSETLAGVSSYSGVTTIAGGTLLVNGSIANSPITVGSGASPGRHRQRGGHDGQWHGGAGQQCSGHADGEWRHQLRKLFRSGDQRLLYRPQQPGGQRPGKLGRHLVAQ